MIAAIIAKNPVKNNPIFCRQTKDTRLSIPGVFWLKREKRLLLAVSVFVSVGLHEIIHLTVFL